MRRINKSLLDCSLGEISNLLKRLIDYYIEKTTYVVVEEAKESIRLEDSIRHILISHQDKIVHAFLNITDQEKAVNDAQDYMLDKLHCDGMIHYIYDSDLSPIPNKAAQEYSIIQEGEEKCLI